MGVVGVANGSSGGGAWQTVATWAAVGVAALALLWAHNDAQDAEQAARAANEISEKANAMADAANATSKEALATAQDANSLAEDANGLAEEANATASEGNTLSEDANDLTQRIFDIERQEQAKQLEVIDTRKGKIRVVNWVSTGPMLDVHVLTVTAPAPLDEWTYDETFGHMTPDMVVDLWRFTVLPACTAVSLPVRTDVGTVGSVVTFTDPAGTRWQRSGPYLAETEEISGEWLDDFDSQLEDWPPDQPDPVVHGLDELEPGPVSTGPCG